MTNDNRPILGISVGDPGGIGPEITLKALNDPSIFEICRPLAVADLRVMRDALRISGVQLELNTIASPQQGHFCHGTVDVLDLANLDPSQHRYKEITAEQGRASFEYVAKVIELAMQGELDGTVTGPICKASINAAGFRYAGHTEIYAELTGTRDYAMMLVEKAFRVVHVSTHVSLREACERVKKDRILRVIRLTDEALRKFDLSAPYIAVAGLNPHAGEDGLFGAEEQTEIIPAIQAALREGIQVEGPVPADTVFCKMLGGMYDAVVVMYHDQGHIPTKLLGFKYDQATSKWSAMSGVNVTLGLPIVRTSVDHGTAFDRAGDGTANPQSMLDALRLGAILSARRTSQGQ